MPWMQHTTLGTLIGPIADDSPMYMELRKLRDSSGRPSWEEQGDQEVAAKLVAVSTNIADPSQAQAFGVVVPALGAAATGLYETGNVGGRAGTVVKATYIPNAAVTGAATNSRTLNVINGGATGAGATNVATLPLVGGTNLVANQENNLNLSGTLAVNGGDAIQFQSLSVGTGIADPGGIAVVTIALT